MSKLVAPDGGVRGIDVKTERGTVKYDVAANGTVSVDNAKHAAQMRSEGFFEASLGSFAAVTGYPCECGFNSLFRKCSKCGKEN